MRIYKYCHFIDISKIDSIKIIKFDWQKTAHNWDGGDDANGDDNTNDDDGGGNGYANKSSRCGGLYLYHSI